MLKFDILLNHSCNFRCKYCFERNSEEAYTSKVMDYPTVDKMIEFIRRTVKDDQAVLCFFGGEPLLSIDKILYMAKKMRYDKNVHFDIISNGSLVESCQYKILYIKELLQKRMSFAISYDYAIQDNRHKDTYTKVRNAIRWLDKKDIQVCTISVFQLEDMHRYYDVIKDYNDLKREIPNLTASFNIDRSTCQDIANYETDIIESITKAKAENLELIKINAACENGGTDPRCFFANIYCGIDCDGSLWPTQNAVYHSETQKKLMYLGNITTDSQEQLDTRRNYILDQIKDRLENPKECQECKYGCRRYKWRSIVSGYDDYNKKADDHICYTYKLVNTLLNE